MNLLREISRFSIIIGVLFFSVQLCDASVGYAKEEAPEAQAGYFDASKWNFAEDGLLSLRGEWEFYWLDLLEPIDFVDLGKAHNDYIEIPTDWTNHTVDGEYLSADGYATLRLQVHVDDSIQAYGLKIKYFASAMKVWVNGELTHSSGQVGTSADAYVPRYMPAEIYFATDSHEIDIVIQVANYHHRRVKLNPVYLGTESQIHNVTYKELIKRSTIFGSLLIIAIYYFILYAIQRRDKAALYFAIIALIIALRHGIMSERIMVRLMPNLPAEIMTKIGYLPVFILLPLLILYIREIFYSPTLDKAANISKYAVVVLAAMVVVTPITFYDWLFQYALVVFFVVAVYMIYIMIKEGFFRDIRGAWIMAVGNGVILITAISDYLNDINIISAPELLSTGILIFIILQAIFLAWKYNDAYLRAARLAEENEAMYEEVQELNERLETKVKNRTKQLELMNQKLEKLSRIDSLTGLANRRAFDERILQEWKRTIREREPISIIMIDIDCFKQYNDNYGHVQGDDCLRLIATELSISVGRGTDFVARYGGEEFVILLPNTSAEGAFIKAEKIRKNIESLKHTHGFSKNNPYITISLGVNTMLATQEESMQEFIKKADEALYRAKGNGRNCTVHADELEI